MTDPKRAALVAAAVRGDLAEVRALVDGGLDLNAPPEAGDTILIAVLGALYWTEPQPHRFDTVRELLRLGADPQQLSDDHMGPLCAPMWAMDTDMLRLLLDAGAQANHEGGHIPSESFYDLAVFDYSYEVWGLDDWPEEPSAADKRDPDAWLRFLDGMAVKHGRRRPDYLQLLRKHGGKTANELRAAGQWPALD